jgi:hypothetical protein
MHFFRYLIIHPKNPKIPNIFHYNIVGETGPILDTVPLCTVSGKIVKLNLKIKFFLNCVSISVLFIRVNFNASPIFFSRDMQEIKKKNRVKNRKIFHLFYFRCAYVWHVKINLSTLVCALVISLYFPIKILFFGAVVLSLFHF